MPRLVLTIPLLLALLQAVGQSPVSERDSVRLLIADMRSTIARLDSSGPSVESIEARMALANLMKSKGALALLDEAAVSADSLGDMQLGMRARLALSQKLSASGDHKRAHAELLRVIGLRDRIDSTDRVRSAEEEADRMASRLQERDSLIAASERRVADANGSAREAQQGADRWMMTSIATSVIALALMVILALRSAQRMRRLRSDLHALRAEVEALKRPRNTYRTPVVPPPPMVPPVHSAPPAEPPPPRLPEDPMVSAMFHRQAPERLAALKDARARGDLDKAVRVVHTLKPTLVSIDGDRFTALCARLVAPGAAGSVAWNTDADALATAIEALLEGP